MAAEVTIRICTGKAACGLGENKSLICKLFSHFHDLVRAANDFGTSSAIADDLRTKGVVALLTHSPVHTFRMHLVVCEEEFLVAVEGGTREFIGLSVEMFGMDQAALPTRSQQLWAGGVPIDHDKGGNFVTAIV